MTRNEIVEKLTSLSRRLRQVEDMLPPRAMTPRTVEEAKAIVVKVRSELEAEYKRMHTIKAQANLTAYETHYYGAIWRSYFGLTSIYPNRRPSQEWRSRVYDARGEIDYVLSGLENGADYFNFSRS